MVADRISGWRRASALRANPLPLGSQTATARPDGPKSSLLWPPVSRRLPPRSSSPEW